MLSFIYLTLYKSFLSRREEGNLHTEKNIELFVTQFGFSKVMLMS